MKIVIPRATVSSKGCDPFDCGRFECDRYFVNGKKQKRPFQKMKQATPGCVQFRCGQVTIPGEEK